MVSTCRAQQEPGGQRQVHVDANDLPLTTRKHLCTHLLARITLPFFQRAPGVALTHRERYDGSGFPFKLRGLAIPRPARFLAARWKE
jgi:response regulator RpfG family c-di-GMP phosphodiesterase